MPYITYEYYSTDYMGELVDEQAFPRLERRASEMIDELTHFAIQQHGFDNYPTFTQTQVKKATAAMVEYLSAIGITHSNFSTEPQQVNIGKFSYSGGGASGMSRFPSGVLSYLSHTGLLYSGISSRDSSFGLPYD